MEPLHDLSRWLQEVSGLSAKTIVHIAGTLIIWALAAGLRAAFLVVIHRRVSDLGRRYTLRKSIGYFLGFAATILTLIIWFGNVTGWAAYLGILSAGLAIALQDPVTNLAGWVFLAIRKPFAVGDRIEIGKHRGDVIDMRLFQFTLMEIGNWVDADQSTGRIVHIPNGWIFKHTTANYTAGFNFIWNELPVTVTFESNWRKARDLLNEIASRHSILADKEAQEQVRYAARKYMISFQYLTPIVWTAVADVGVTLTVRYICEPRRRRSSAGAIWEDVLDAFAACEDIDFAYPTTRYFNNVTEGKSGARAETPPA